MEIAKSRDQSCVEESKKVVGKGRGVQVHLEFENKIFSIYSRVQKST